ncbi:MAG: AarF/UbiB family protein [Bacteroidales bacterium]
MSILLNIFKIPRTIRHLKRYHEIGFTIVKYGMGEIFSISLRLSLSFLRIKRRRENSILRRYTRFERVRLAMEELGPTFVKFGQILSNRPDILPQELIEELENLQNDVAPFPFELAEEILKTEWKQNKEDYFIEFNPKPLASGSIAQVHEAVTKSGQRVVVKIQRPGIQSVIDTDIEIMQFIARSAQKRIKYLKDIDLISVINEFKSTIHREIDFNFEVSHIERFKNNFCNDGDIYVPEVYKELCTKSVLVMEYINGYTINEICSTGNLLKIDPKDIAEKGAKLILKQVFTYGFFHADPHPGNILILPDSRICFLDYGMTGSVPTRYRQFLADIILGFVSRDSSRIVNTLMKFSKAERDIDLNSLEIKVSELVDEFTFIPLNKIDSVEVLNKIRELLVQYRLSLPPTVFLLAKSLIIIEGVARKLDPDFNISNYVQPFAKKLISEKINPIEFFKKNYPKAIDLVNNMLEFPSALIEITAMLRDGKLNIGQLHRNEPDLLKKEKKLGFVLAISIVAASLVIGSSVFIALAISPLWKGISIPGIIFFAFALILVFGVFFKSR